MSRSGRYNAVDSITLSFFFRLVLPIQHEPLDIQTPEPFHSDQLFSSKWISDTSYYKYKDKADFISVCDILDKSYVIGVEYKVYKVKTV